MPLAVESVADLMPTLAPLHLADQSMDHALSREYRWYAGTNRFADVQVVREAVSAGVLVEFTDDADLRRLPRFSNDVDGFWPFLTKPALDVAKDMGILWREILAAEFGIVRPELRLAVTSMVRTLEYQRLLVEGGRYASQTSTHCVGAAFDLDDSSYYRQEADGSFVSCANPEAIEARTAAAEVIRRRMADGTPPMRFDNEYDPRVNIAAEMAATYMHENGLINRLKEFPDKPYSVLHVAANPDYARQ